MSENMFHGSRFAYQCICTTLAGSYDRICAMAAGISQGLVVTIDQKFSLMLGSES
jgi:hypothetical protein